MACPNCGSWGVRADRSLSGRMVCVRCGHPLGVGAQVSRRRGGAGGPWRFRQRRGRGLGGWKLGLLALLMISALLAALPPPRLSPPAPAPWPSGGKVNSGA
jgi:hypothetical protein